MRVALLASTIALLAGSPAFAQCVYVACGGSVPNPPAYQQPVYQAPVQTTARGDYDAGYAAGLAARPRTRVVTRTISRPVHRAAAVQSTHRHAAVAKPRSAVRPAVRQVDRVAPRPTVRPAVRPATHHVTRVVPRSTVRPVRTVSQTFSQQTYVDPIKNRAGTYGASTYGSSTSMASLMSRTTWVGPSAVTSQNGQSCGWGARIVLNDHGQAQRQAMWVCQCPQGWRPPGY